MKQPPLISIITVVFNRKDTIALTLNSVFSQTYQHIEYIVIDGGSTDGTLDRLTEYRNQLTRLVSEPDQGLYDAMNKGLDLAKGDFCLFLNAGDTFYRSESLATLVEAVTDRDVFYYGIAIMTDGEHIYRLNPRVNVVDGLPVNGEMPNHQASLFPRCFYLHNRYDLSFRIAADDDYKIRAIRALPVRHIPVWTVIFELGGLSRDLSRFRSVTNRWRDASAMYRKHYAHDRRRLWAVIRFQVKTLLLYFLQSITGFHWRYELWFNKFKRIPPEEHHRFRTMLRKSPEH